MILCYAKILAFIYLDYVMLLLHSYNIFRVWISCNRQQQVLKSLCFACMQCQYGGQMIVGVGMIDREYFELKCDSC